MFPVIPIKALVRSLVSLGVGRTMSSAEKELISISGTYVDAEKIQSAAISSVSPPDLITKTLFFDRKSNILTVKDRKFPIHNNVKVVAFGKAVLGMVAAVENILANHIAEGVASVPVGALETAKKFYSHHLPHPNSNIRIYEGAAGNLPDSVSEAAAKEILSVARRCREDDILIALISGGGSALLSYPVEGITLEEKRKITESLARRGANILEINTVRTVISQTKGGKLAEAAFPAKVLGLVLSDVIGDPLEIIASGPTVPRNSDTGTEALKVIKKYNLEDECASVTAHLRSNQNSVAQVTRNKNTNRVLNIVIGSNEVATSSAKATAISLGYTCYVWSWRLEGEARDLGELYAMITCYIMLKHQLSREDSQSLTEMLHGQVKKLSHKCPQLEADFLNLVRMADSVDERPFCLIGAGEPTVTVTGGGRGGRNQELVLAYAIKLNHLRNSYESDGGVCVENSVFASIGTDGQDGPNDGAGAIIDPLVFTKAQEEGLDPVSSLLHNDSYTFFSKLNSGKNLMRIGLTGTNVMDIHLLLMK